MSDISWYLTELKKIKPEILTNEEAKILEENNVKNDPVNHPLHYTNSGMECIDEMISLYGIEEVRSFCKLNAHKYRKRAMYKGGKEDIEKSDWYIKKYTELSIRNQRDIMIDIAKKYEINIYN